jgi:hypothetical protein
MELSAFLISCCVKICLQVIVHGTREATEHLANFCEQAGWASGRVHTPRIKETVNVTSETHMFEAMTAFHCHSVCLLIDGAVVYRLSSVISLLIHWISLKPKTVN